MFRNQHTQHNLYDILEVSPKATTQVIEAAYKALVKKYHPDLNAGISDHKIKLLNMAREVLIDDQKRREYDGSFNLHHSQSHKTTSFSDMSFMRGENERLKREVEDLQKRLAAKPKNDDNMVYVLCTSCGTRNRLPNLSFLSMQNIKCGMCKTPFGTGNRDFEREKAQKEKASLAKRAADIEWRRISDSLGKAEYARIEALLKKYQEVQEIYPKVYGLKTKLKALKDELMLRNSNAAVFRKIVDSCSEELSKHGGHGLFGMFKKDDVAGRVRERLMKEILMYPRVAEERIVYNCRDCKVKNAVKVDMFIKNCDNILCGSCHSGLFK